MAAPQILVNADTSRPATPPLAPAPDFGWTLMGLLGFVFLISGTIDLGLLLWPLQFGNAEWEFGTAGSVFNALPVPMLGVVLLLGSAVARGSRTAVKVWSAACLLVAILLLGFLIVYALDVPLAFRAVQEPLARFGLKRSVAKTLAQAVLYPTAFLALAFKGWRHGAVVRRRTTA
ncbi:MAG: hypothetical protein ABJA94_11445 [Rhodoglobus sp.]